MIMTKDNITLEEFANIVVKKTRASGMGDKQISSIGTRTDGVYVIHLEGNNIVEIPFKRKE